VNALSRRPDYDQGQDNNQDVTVLPEQVFVRATEVLSNQTTQDAATLKPWIDPHQLKQHQGTWYKDRKQVVTGNIEAKCHIIQSHHDSPVTGTQASVKLYNSWKDYTGGQRCDRKSWNTSKDVRNAKDIKSIPNLPRHHYNQYIPN
jgi:hypothetical protein